MTARERAALAGIVYRIRYNKLGYGRLEVETKRERISFVGEINGGKINVRVEMGGDSNAQIWDSSADKNFEDFEIRYYYQSGIDTYIRVKSSDDFRNFEGESRSSQRGMIKHFQGVFRDSSLTCEITDDEERGDTRYYVIH